MEPVELISFEILVQNYGSVSSTEISRYAMLLEERLSELYPEAEVIIVLDEQTSGVWRAPKVSGGSQSDVDTIVRTLHEIWDSEDWKS